VIIGGLIGYCAGVRLYYNPEYEKTMQSFHNYIKEKRQKATQLPEPSNLAESMGNLIKAKQKDL
jgi:hypothetical protein